MLLPHAVPNGKTSCATVSQQTPAVQQPGLSPIVHSPTLVLHTPILHATPPPSQSPSDWQQPGCAVPLHVPAEVQTSLNVQALLSLQNVPGLAVHAFGLLSGTQN